MTSAILVTNSNNFPGLLRTIFYILFFSFSLNLNFVNLSYSSFDLSQGGQLEIATYSPPYMDGFEHALIATQSPSNFFQKTGKDFSIAGLFIPFSNFRELEPAGLTYQTFQRASFTNILDQLHHHLFFF